MRRLVALTTQSLLVCAVVATALADPVTGDTPTAIRRTNAENYKDRLLASCIATAYKDAPAAHKDAGITASVFIEWTYFDLEKADDAPAKLIEQFLRKDYHNPLEGYAGVRFDLLKCIDMYHSPELAAQVRKFVPHPNWIGDRPPTKRK